MSADLKAAVSIELTQGKFALVSESDFPLVSRHKWHAVLCGKKWYARRSHHVGGRSRKTVCIYMHREIAAEIDLPLVDHLNGDGLDNRRENLRAASARANALNLQAKHFAGGLRGVFAQQGKFLARVGDEYGGCFDSVDEAAFAANRILDRVSPGIGYRNVVDFEALLNVLRARQAAIQSYINAVEEARHAG